MADSQIAAADLPGAGALALTDSLLCVEGRALGRVTVEDVLALMPLPAHLGDYVVAAFQGGAGSDGAVLLVHRLRHAIVLPPGLAGWTADALHPFTGQADYVLSYVRGGASTPVVTFRFAPGATAATLVNPTVPVLQDGDVLVLAGPAKADATGADVGWTIIGSKE